MLLRARLFRAKGLEGQNMAIEYYQKSLALDTTFAQAYAELAQVYWNSGYLGVADQNAAFVKAEAAALKAIALDGSSYDGYNMLSFLNLTKDWDWESSSDNYEKAVSLGLPVPDRWHAYYQCWLFGSNDQIIDEAELLVEKDPLSVEALVHLSRIYFYAKRYDDVIANAKKTLEISPNQSSILRQMGEAYLFSSRPDQALSCFQKLMEMDARYVPQDLIAAYVKLGKKETALARFNEMQDSMGPVKKAICYIWLGDNDHAFASLEEAYHEKDAGMIGIKVDPHFERVRSDPRFQKILQLMRFPS
jgi:tetratricopeptide (TPR) repeat protein